MQVNSHSAPLQTYYSVLGYLDRRIAHTESLERCLKVVKKSIQLYTNAKENTANLLTLNKLKNQLTDTIEILAVAQTVNLVHELSCPNESGLYYFARSTWQKSIGRIFYLFYSICGNLHFLAKFEFIQLGKIHKIAIGHLSLFRMVSEGQYVLYRIFSAWDGIVTKSWWKVALSIGKIFVTISLLLIEMMNVQRIPVVMTITAISLIIECLGMT